MRIEGPGFSLRPAIDFNHINMSQEQIGKRLHGGAELVLPILTLRGA